jgi:hypothetical protein
MVSSFRLTENEECLLKLATSRTGKSRSAIAREAIQAYCKQLLNSTAQTPYERLMAAGFQPVDLQDNDLSYNKTKQRRLIRERLSKSRR